MTSSPDNVGRILFLQDLGCNGQFSMNKGLVGEAVSALLEHYIARRHVMKCLDAGAIFRPVDPLDRADGFSGYTDSRTLDVQIVPADTLAKTMLAVAKEVRHVMQAMHGLRRLINTLGPQDYLACHYLLEADAIAYQAQIAAGFDETNDRSLIRAMSQTKGQRQAIKAFLAHRQMAESDYRDGYLAAMATFSDQPRLDHFARAAASTWKDGIFGKGDLAWAARTGHQWAPGKAKTFSRALANMQRVPDRLPLPQLEAVLATMQQHAQARLYLIEAALSTAYATRI